MVIAILFGAVAVLTQPAVALAGSPYPYFGAVVETSDAPIAGARVSIVRSDSPAARAGIQPGDVLVKFSGVPTSNAEDFHAALRSHRHGVPDEIVYVREGREYRTQAMLKTRKTRR